MKSPITVNPEDRAGKPAERIRRIRLPVLLLLFSILVCLVWFSLVVSGNYRFDSDRMIYDRNVAISQYRSEGRIILAFFLQSVLPETWNPLLNGILFLLFFIASGWVLTSFISRCTERKWNPLLYGLFYLLYASSPVWAFQFYFTLQSAAVALGMVLAVLAAGTDVLLRTERTFSQALRIPAEFLILACCVALMLIYQSLIIFYATVLIVLLFCRLLHGVSVSWKVVVFCVFRTVLSLVFYVLIARTVRSGESDYLMYQIQWGHVPLSECLKDIAVEFGKILFMSHSGHFSLYLPGLILLIILLVRKRKSRNIPKREFVLLVFSAAAILLLPLAISIMEGSRPVPRTQFALQLVAAFMPVCFLAESGRPPRLLLFLAVCAVFLQSMLVLRLAYTDNRRNAWDIEAASRITQDLDAVNADENPVVFLGTLSFPDDSVWIEKTDVFGLSFFEWSWQPDRAGSASSGTVRLLKAATGKKYSLPKQRTINEASRFASGMPSYPDDGYIRVMDHYCIVKLSD